MQGFKSFADPVSIELNDGVTCIIGPNGSGKSNISDALRWVLGEQKIKQLRGSRMEDVIFAGTANRKPLGFAFVSITLDNSDHKLKLEFDEVTISRRVFRSGESEYMINGSVCRLRDVQELLYDTGIGKEGYSIIGQGQIDKILQGKPEERRELFDEAVGIVKYKKRKTIALRKLENERLNMSRVKDILSELGRQVGPLRRQSEAADKYVQLRDELKKYDIQAIQYPFSELKEKGSIGYISEGEYTIEKPEPFNMEQEQLSLTGRHNIYNSLAAGIAGDIAGIKKDVIRESLSDFPGVEHRLEKVATVRGVYYVNDSKATNVDACWYALDSMKTKVVLIVGGKDKGNDYEPIKPLVREKCSAIIYLGADNGKLHDNFDALGLPVRDTHSMKDCVAACYELAQPGETVLLSPCCASFDLFKNMEDRGEQFKELVKNL